MDFLRSLLANPRKALRSALTTALAVVAGLAALQQAGLGIDPQWIVWAGIAVTVLRTVLGALDPKQTLYGRGSQ